MLFQTKWKHLSKQDQIKAILIIVFLGLVLAVIVWAYMTEKIIPWAQTENQIINQATVTYQDASGNTYTAQSNIVTTEITQLTQATLALDPVTISANVGDNFNVNIVLNTGQHDTQEAQAILTFNNLELEVQDADPGTAGTQIGSAGLYTNVVTNQASGGTITYKANNNPGDTPYNNTGSLATITFKALKAADPTQVNFNFTPGQTDDSNVIEQGTTTDILGSVANGTYTLVGGTQETQVNIAVRLQGGTNFGKSGIIFRIYETGTATLVFEQTDLTTDGNGNLILNLSQQLSGNYDYWIKVPYYLAEKIINMPFTNPLDLNFDPLRAGDFDNSGEVNMLDFGMMASKWGQADPLTDIDQSGEVNMLDFGVMANNWGAAND